MKVLLAENELLEAWHSCLGKSEGFHIAMALVTRTGLDQLIEALQSRLDCGAKGRMLIGTDLPTDPQSLSEFRDLQTQYPDQFKVRRFGPDRTRVFHPKFSIFVGKRGRKFAIIGSSNMSQGGLNQNIEANILVDSAQEIRKLLKFFDVLFLGYNSNLVSASWLKEYQKQWAERKSASDALRRSREKVRRIKVKPPQQESIPSRIKNATFVFTGALGNGWNRKTVLKKVDSYGGTALNTHPSVKQADCLVEGRIHPYLESTRKLEVAREYNIPIIDAEGFLEIYETEAKLRRRKRR